MNVSPMFTVGRIQRAIKDGLLPSFTDPELRALVAWLDTLEATPETEEIRQTVMKELPTGGSTCMSTTTVTARPG